MNLRLQRFADRWIGVPACRLLTAWSAIMPAPKPREPRHILVILLSEMGSLALAAPMLDQLRRAHPNAELHALVFARNRGFLELLARVPPGNVHTIRDTSLAWFAVDTCRVLRRLRCVPIDTTIDCELFSRVSSIVSYLSGAAVRVGFHRHRQEGLYRGNFINRPVLYNPYVHIARQFLHLADAIDARDIPLVKRPVPIEPLALPQVDMSREEIAAFRQALSEAFPRANLDRLVLLYPGGGLLPIRAWPEVHYAQVCRTLCDRGFTVAVIGLGEDATLAQRVLAGCAPDRALNLAGYTRTMRDLIALFHVARLLITNDGGPGHFAALTPLPVIIFFGPETPALYAPLSPRVHPLFAGLSCSPCLTAYNHRNSPCDGNNVCLRAIDPAQVLGKAFAILAAS